MSKNRYTNVVNEIGSRVSIDTIDRSYAASYSYEVRFGDLFIAKSFGTVEERDSSLEDLLLVLASIFIDAGNHFFRKDDE